MKVSNAQLIRYDADEGKYIEWKEPRFDTDENGNQVRVYLKAKTLYIGNGESITNYVEVDTDGNITELEDVEFATQYDYEDALAELGVE